MTTFNAELSREARDQGIEAVTRKKFMANGLNTIRNLSPGEYTGEDIRRALTTYGVTPHHHNAWGALIRSAVKTGILIDTGTVRQMKDVASHARRTPIYTKAAV